MPFEHLTPRPFTPHAVRAFAPEAPGVYGISNSREWIYIGEGEDIQGSLLAHLQSPATAVMRQAPTGFVFEVCAGTERHARQDRLVLEYEPTFNRQKRRQQ